MDADDIHIQYEYEFELDDELVKLNKEINEKAEEEKAAKIELRVRMAEATR